MIRALVASTLLGGLMLFAIWEAGNSAIAAIAAPYVVLANVLLLDSRRVWLGACGMLLVATVLIGIVGPSAAVASVWGLVALVTLCLVAVIRWTYLMLRSEKTEPI